MIQTIWKYQVPIDGLVHDITSGAVLAVGQQDKTDEVVFWAFNRTDEVRSFFVAGTGHPLPPGGFAHRGTVQVPNLGLVWHLLEVVEIPLEEETS